MMRKRSFTLGAAGVALCLLSAFFFIAGPRDAAAAPDTNDAAVSALGPKRQVILLGLRRRGKPQVFASQVSNPGSPQYRKFLTQEQYRQRFSATATDQRRVKEFLGARKGRGVFSFSLNPSRTVVLAVVTPGIGARLFCFHGSKPLPARGLCRPKPIRGAVRQVSAGAIYQPPKKRATPSARSKNTGTPEGCEAGRQKGTFAPNQLSTAYGVDGLKDRGLDGSGIRAVTLSSQMVDPGSFKTWARCFDLPTPKVKQVAMPGFGGTSPEETVLDVEALASLAPNLDRITPIFVPLDQGFSNSFNLFMFGALDPSRQGGKLPDILSLSDGVCENSFTKAELQLGQRQLAEAAAMGITTIAAVGDLGFRGCFTSARGTDFPASSRFVTGVGGTELFLSRENAIDDQVVWSTYGSGSSESVGTGGGASPTWPRPAFQTGPGIDPRIQTGKPARLTPDIASMASFTPGIATYQSDGGGWGLGGGNSTATPLTAAIVSLVLQQESKAGRPPLGSLNPLLYQLARGPGYSSVFYDIVKGTSSRKPKTAAGKAPAGGAAQPGYDLATGLGTLKATAFAEAVAGVNAP